MNKKGFTLVELIAVITILAIILTITMTSISAIINKNKKNIFERSIDELTNSALEYTNKLYESDMIDGFYQFTFDNGKLLFGSNEVKINNGTNDFSGTFKIDGNGNISSGSFYYPSRYCLIINNNKKIYKNIKETTDKSMCTEIYTDTVLNGADPVISDGMIPVGIANDGKVKKADITSKWYDYTNRLWANVVLVNEDSREKYQNALSNTEIDSSDILAYFVWIPRYRYQLFNSTTPIAINIQFEDKFKEKSLDTNIGGWLTHPAFTFGDEELNGIWFGKFETTRMEDINNENDGIITVLPGAIIMIGTNLGPAFEQIKRLNNMDFYGIDNDAHITKNSEWGAAVYLTYSLFGRCTSVSSCTEVSRNNYYYSTTGYGEVHKATTGYSSKSISTNEFGPDSSFSQPYNTSTGYLASTTGNITGIYDMSAGGDEMVMAVLTDFETKLEDSGFTYLPQLKYYDVYNNSDESIACDGHPCYGQALSETSGWFDDLHIFVDTKYPFLERGGRAKNGTGAGITYYTGSFAGGADDTTYRIALVPKK